MAERLIDVDEVTGLETYHDYDALTDETHIIHRADATPVLERNKAMQNDPSVWKDGVKNEFVLYASIPVGVQVKWLVELGVDVYNKDHGKKVGELVNSPEYAYLRTTTKYHRFKGEG